MKIGFGGDEDSRSSYFPTHIKHPKAFHFVFEHAYPKERFLPYLKEPSADQSHADLSSFEF